MKRIKKNYTVNLYEVTGLDEDGDIVRSKILVDLGEDDPFIDKVYNVEDYVRQTLIASFSKKFPFGKMSFYQLVQSTKMDAEEYNAFAC